MYTSINDVSQVLLSLVRNIIKNNTQRVGEHANLDTRYPVSVTSAIVDHPQPNLAALWEIVHWHLLMLAYSLLKFGAADSVLGTILARAMSLRAEIKRSFRESVENLSSWALTSPTRSTNDLMYEIEGMFI